MDRVPLLRSLIALAKRVTKQLFNTVGLEIRKKQHDGMPRTSMAGALHQLSTLGFDPRTVIDVGVVYHTSELYQQFKKAGILLIEPLVEFEPFLLLICSSYNAQYVLAANGENPGTSVLNVHPDKVGSSFLKEIEGPKLMALPGPFPSHY